MKTVERILVPLDRHPGSEHVLEYAAAIARGLGATIRLFHVYWPPNSMVGIVPGASVTEDAAEEASLGRALLARAKGDLQTNALDRVEMVLERAPSPSIAIVEASRLGCGLVVIGMHGRKRASVLMGSVAYQVLRNAPCPVLAVHLPHE
ncbi:MAG TPA: universal stress protein [Polyangiaceae bacterium]